MRDTIRKFCDSELSPHADRIDKENGWDDGYRPFMKKLGDMGLLGITAPGIERGGASESSDVINSMAGQAWGILMISLILYIEKYGWTTGLGYLML